eukprot:5522490-Pleurochrysis_carterae.AAC.2
MIKAARRNTNPIAIPAMTPKPMALLVLSASMLSELTNAAVSTVVVRDSFASLEMTWYCRFSAAGGSGGGGGGDGGSGGD